LISIPTHLIDLSEFNIRWVKAEKNLYYQYHNNHHFFAT
jgi:hypothetical protein